MDKAGAAVLLRDREHHSNTIGVTVSPVRIATLAEFGDVSQIGDKLLATERGKDSTVPGGVRLLSESSRTGGASGAVFYDYDYTLITTHGNKRVFCSVGVRDNTLFILNAMYKIVVDGDGEAVKDAATTETENALAATYQDVVASFDVGRV